MECIWDAALLGRGDQLPSELLYIIQNGDNEQYLHALTQAALNPRYTYTLVVHCENLLAQVCATIRSHASFASSIATLGRIVPFAPFLTPYATGLLSKEAYSSWSSADDREALLYLLGFLRLLRFDHRTFRQYVRPHELTMRLGVGSRPVTYVIIRILQIYLHAADHWFEETFKRYLGQDTPDGDINGPWDGKMIDYRFLSLWEEDRYESVLKSRSAAENSTLNKLSMAQRVIPSQDLHPSTSLIGNALLPRATATQTDTASRDSLVHTATITANLQHIAHALKSPRPALLTGLAGSGKSLLVRHVAERLGKLDDMVTLHLNEQSDAKLLLGVYTTGETQGSFVWKPGVLTTAVLEGRWVLIEDLDRAPNEVLGTLLPLIEKRQLLLPNRKETIHAAEGFRILATVRSSVNHRGEETKPLTHMIGSRHWQAVSITMPSTAEQEIIAKGLFPKLQSLLPQFMAVYDHLVNASRQPVLVRQSKTGVARSISPRDLLKWCRRVSLLLKDGSSFTSSDLDAMYLEAIDCFVGALPDDSARVGLTAIVAEELRIDPQRRDYLLYTREAQYQANKTVLKVGRYTIPKVREMKVVESSFSTNPHTSRMLERVAAAVLNREPLLLVGETGVGKTTAVQHLAKNLGKKLVPFNLSQQSEAGDLLGGFKPVNTRTLMVPLKDDFDALFSESFSSSKNKQFLELLGKHMAKSNWKTVCKLWRQALGMVDQQRAKSPSRDGEAPSKKRKVDSKRPIRFSRWDIFADKVEEMEKMLANGSDAFAFTFVEGNIVKAVRDGDWVLFDEINLASSDTLEAITDLLDSESPSLLLTEAGNIERINAHHEFRVFAAMNPATDVGKKDLSPGIRSRFTELYVESPDKDLKSLQSIVKAYLRQESAADPALPSDVSLLYQKIIALAAENKLVDGAGQKPHFSLRTLTRTLSFAKHIQQMCSIRRALYEGFQMSFLTFLDTESVQLVQPSIEQHLFGKRSNTKSELQKALRKPNDGRSYIQGYPASKSCSGSKHWIRQGTEALEDQQHYIITPFVRGNLENLIRAASTRQFPVLIQGPTSSGKTSMIEYLAKRTGHRFIRINNHEHTDLQEYLGTYVSGTDGRLQFQEGVFVKALREGHWIVLDELNLAPTDVLEALNRLLDDNRELLVPETQETIRPHSDFMLFATQNPAGLYGGRKTLSRAFRNRFLELHFDDIPVNELQEILHRRTQLPDSRCMRIVQVYKELSNLRQENRMFEQKSFATLRDLFRWALRQNDTIEQLAANGYMLLCERVRKPDERVALKAIIENVMSKKGPRVQINEEALYAEDSPEILQHRRNVSNANMVWTKAMRRLYVLVSRAIQNSEPVLLVGETGCGKTTVCQMLAEALQKELHTVNAHQNTETGDLIGSQRPVRNRAALETRLRQLLFASPSLQAFERPQSAPTESLLNVHDSSIASLNQEQKKAYVQSPEHAEIQATRTRSNALFEWVDGSLVQAMRNGAFFLLDEISLADDSVLERINSVLESQRTILLAEKGSLDSSVTAATEFQFFATMNPGGDYGKRELSPALRNRFTEIWVPALSDMEDVLQIVQAKLVEPAQSAANAMVGFASWFKTRFDTSASSSVSIRDTLAWVDFVNTFASLQVHAAVVHGAAMVYIDTLGANPAGLMSLTSLSLEEERQACLTELARLLGIDAQEIYQQPLQVTSSVSNFGIGPFTIARTQHNTPSDVSFTFDPPTTRSNAMRILRALQLRKPVMLEGSPGVGKTALVTAIASAAGMPLTRINLSDQTDLLDLFGSDAPVEGAQTGTFVWRDAPFLRAMKNGEWVLLDEMNLASQSVLEGLNACLDHRGEVFVPELGQAFLRHPAFRLFAAQNPHHQGGGRKGLPASFVNRFTVVYADSFAPGDLMLISQRMFTTVDKTYLEQVIAFVSRLNDAVTTRREFGSTGGPWEFNLRDIARWLELATSGKGLLKAGSARDFVDTLFTQRFRSSIDKTRVEELFASVFDKITPVADLFCNVSTQSLQVGLGLLSRDALSSTPKYPGAEASTSSADNIRNLQSVMLCVQENWPVVLVGSPGTGKTSLIERLAASVGADVVTFAMNAETDALDLIGGYEQYDPHRQVAQAMRQTHRHVDRVSKLGLTDESVLETAHLFSALHELDLDPSSSTCLSRLIQYLPHAAQAELSTAFEILRTTSHTIDKAKFEWNDGPLIEALQLGHWFVLDNANLCSPSVLDRLNSLLEPNGALIVNEHTTPDGAPRIYRPHASFRIFLTVDPRLGELSRAMRNRAVEIYMMPVETNAVASTDGLHTESAMARLHVLKTAGSLRNANDHGLAILQDHLASSDSELLSRLHSQLQNGLFNVPSSLALLPAIRPSLSANSSSVEGLYKEVSSSVQTPADFACAQTLHPLNNQPLVQQSPYTLYQALSLAAQYDMGVAVTLAAKAVLAAKSDRKVIQRLSRFWKSAQQVLTVEFARYNATPLDFVEKLLHSIYQWLGQIDLIPQKELAAVRTTISVLISYCRTLLQSILSDSLDWALLIALNSVGRAIATADLSTPSTGLSTVLARFHNLVDEISLQPLAGTGRGYTTLWKIFRPAMPATMDHLQAILKFEDVIDRFDLAASAFQLLPSQIVELRMAFHRNLVVGAAAETDIDTLAERAIAVIPQVKLDEDGEAPTVMPHFMGSFELLCQHFASLDLQDVSSRTPDTNMLEVFARRKTIESMSLRVSGNMCQPQQTLRLLSLSLPRSVSSNYNTYSISQSILQSLKTLDNVSLRDLALLEAESQSLGSTVASKADLVEISTLPAHDACLRYLLQAVLQNLATTSKIGDLASMASYLVQVLRDGLLPTDAGEIPEQFRSKSTITGQTSAASRLWAVVNYLLSAQDDRGPRASGAWTSFAVACFELYIPEHAYDPVQESQIHRAVYQRTQDDLQSRLSTLHNLREHWVGVQDSLRARLLQEDLQTLDPAPYAVEICRPETSQLGQVQAEFQTLMRILKPLRFNQTNDTPGALLEGSAWSNLRVIRNRLQQQYRPYADLTTPVVGFIDCLSVAQRLASQSEYEQSNVSASTANITPTLGLSIDDWLSDERFIQIHQACRSKDEQLYWLSALAVRSRSISIAKSSQQLRSAIDSTFRNFYEFWRVELSRDQKLTAAKSSLYQYRGGDDDSEEATQEQLDELFPSYDGNLASSPAKKETSSAQALAPRMAALYRFIHSQSNADEQGFGDLLQLWNETTTATSSSGRRGNLPAVIFAMSKLNSGLAPANSTSRKANIYVDAMIDQSRALVSLVSKVQTRFATIHDAWPEHATPIQAIRACKYILTLGHTEPLARFLPPVEVLHATINEWQKVASSHYSASDLLEQTTNLIVSWRQLELSTWAGMFNSEDESCKRNAASWWYIAYETIIRASEESSQDRNALEEFAKGLLETLSSFLSACGLGEYAVRLEMLRAFEAALTTRSADQPDFFIIRNALANLISFYSRYETVVSEQLAKKRADLEKDIKNVVQLASWKDRNIETLRQSAKASHRKLFRTVRKYRQLLSQPVAPILLNEFPYINLAADVRKGRNSWHFSDTNDRAPLAPIILQSWDGRPDHFADFDVVAKELRARTASIVEHRSATSKIEKFLEELNEESSELRKATPNTATEENKTIVQHLKTRKRRLLADILRDVRVMGFQTNISDAVVSQQHSLSMTLARTSPLVYYESRVELNAADQEFHRLLHIMPAARESAAKPSEDLTPAEVARSKVLLEGMLQLSIEQRKALCQQLSHHATLRTNILQHVRFCSGEELKIQTTSSWVAYLTALRSMLQTSIQCVQMQSQLGGSDYHPILETLRTAGIELDGINHAIAQHKDLPPHIDNANLRSLNQRFKTAVEGVITTISDHVLVSPELEPTLAHLLEWSRASCHTADYGNTTPQPPMSADLWIRDFLQILERMRTYAPSNVPKQVNGQAKKAWLLEHQATIQSAAQDLQVGLVSQDLSALMSRLHRVEPDNGSSLTDIAAICRTAFPLIEAYAEVSEGLVLNMASLHDVTSKMAHKLATSFVQLTRQGFCQPSEKAQDEQKSGQAESGTGLGEGEGGEDISKDIGDDEDLSELAQDATSKDKNEETDAEKDAVDMADEDLEGNFDEEVDSEGDEEEDQSGQEDGEMDEEAGQVGDQDSGAVDEKTWDDGKAEEADKEADKGKGTKSEDISAANEQAKDEPEDTPQDGEDGEAGEDDAEAGAEMESEVEHKEPEKADPHMNDEENLDLPEDLNMDGDKADASDISDGGSDIVDDMDQMDTNEPEEAGQELDVEMGDETNDQEAEENGEADAAERDDEAGPDPDEQNSDVAMLDNQDGREQPADGLTSADEGHGNEDDNAAQTNGTLSAAEQLENENDVDQPNEQPGTAEGSNRTQQDTSSGQAEVGGHQQQPLPYKQLGDVLKQWYDQHRNIEAAQETEGPEPETNDPMDMTDARFEHTDNAESDMQAIGAARADQSKALDEQNAVPLEQNELDNDPRLEEPPIDLPDLPEDDTTESGGKMDSGKDSTAHTNKAMVGTPTEVDMTFDEQVQDASSEIEDVDEQLTNTHLAQDSQDLLSIEEARQAWSEHESRTRNMAVVLTEHLRLILQPTQATKMRGDFRTGKRLNIKKIIPYIASSYKRDKIWMRRSIPSKRSYQIMLAIDDSESMNEHKRKGLAFDTLALVAKSMAMLEVGELCIVGFGQTVNINHDFSMPFTSDAGAEVMRQFSFTQTKTDVRRLLEKSINLFRSARLKASNSASNLWQLQLIISDGLCDDHPSIRQLVRQAHDEQIMVVFIVVDASVQETSTVAVGPKQSIVDLPRAEFTKDANGEPVINMGKYLDTFPFRYYLIVRDVLELPSVLAGALRQWFSEVVETGN